jgi:ubiquitin thioesterase OTU1
MYKAEEQIVSIESKPGQNMPDSLTFRAGFGEERGYETHVLLIYSGIHYDAVTFTPMEPEAGATYPYSLDFDQTQFRKTTDGYALPATLELAQKLRAKKYYTDTAGFSLRCEVCKKALKGEKEAQAHAQSTGHTSFGEF